MNEGSHQELVLVAGGTSESVRYCTRCLRGLGHRVLCANTLHELLVMEAREQPDVILLDEDFSNSVEAVRHLRQASTVPIIFMAFVAGPMAAQGLRVGADAILPKPYTAELLDADIECVIRRSLPKPSEASEDDYQFGGLSVNFRARIVYVNGARVHLSAREYRLLQVLIRNAGLVLTHDQILRLVWGPGYEDSYDLLRGYVRNLRKKLGDDARRPRLVHTESQVGYWMEKSEREVAAA